MLFCPRDRTTSLQLAVLLGLVVGCSSDDARGGSSGDEARATTKEADGGDDSGHGDDGATAGSGTSAEAGSESGAEGQDDGGVGSEGTDSTYPPDDASKLPLDGWRVLVQINPDWDEVTDEWLLHIDQGGNTRWQALPLSERYEGLRYPMLSPGRFTAQVYFTDTERVEWLTFNLHDVDTSPPRVLSKDDPNLGHRYFEIMPAVGNHYLFVGNTNGTGARNMLSIAELRDGHFHNFREIWQRESVFSNFQDDYRLFEVDGRSVLLLRGDLDADESDELYRIDLGDGSEVTTTRLTDVSLDDSGIPMEVGEWWTVPDDQGTQVLFLVVRRDGGHREALRTLDLAEDEPESKELLTDLQPGARKIQLSADGKFVVYYAPESPFVDKFDLYVHRIDGLWSEPKLRLNTNPGELSEWEPVVISPDGRRVFYNVRKLATRYMYAVELGAEGPQSPVLALQEVGGDESGNGSFQLSFEDVAVPPVPSDRLHFYGEDDWERVRIYAIDWDAELPAVPEDVSPWLEPEASLTGRMHLDAQGRPQLYGLGYWEDQWGSNLLYFDRRTDPAGDAYVIHHQHGNIGAYPGSVDDRWLIFTSFNTSSTPPAGLFLFDLHAPEQPPKELTIPRQGWTTHIDFLAVPDQ